MLTANADRKLVATSLQDSLQADKRSEQLLLASEFGQRLVNAVLANDGLLCRARLTVPYTLDQSLWNRCQCTFCVACDPRNFDEQQALRACTGSRPKLGMHAPYGATAV